MLLPAVLLSWLLALCPPHGAQTREPAVELSAAPGTIELVEGSPVALSEPRRVLLKPALSPDGVQEIVIRAETKIENTSGRAIRRLKLSFCYGGRMTGIMAADGIGANETRSYSDESTHIRGLVPVGPAWALTVKPIGAEFADGTHWACPRANLAPLVPRALHQAGSPLIIRKCDLNDDGYSATLVASTYPQVVAYRLGTVKDIPATFEVRLGKWVSLSENDSSSIQNLAVTDDGKSLTADEMFRRELEERTSSDGKVVNLPFGVAIFVAEVRFADGRVWRQDLSRDALFWDD